jgi:hypothetical protein
MKIFIIAGFILAMTAGVADAKVVCKDPKTHKFIKCPAAAAAPMSSSSAAAPSSSASHPPHCTTGKVCGNSCIAKDKVCHK